MEIITVLVTLVTALALVLLLALGAVLVESMLERSADRAYGPGPIAAIPSPALTEATLEQAQVAIFAQVSLRDRQRREFNTLMAELTRRPTAGQRRRSAVTA